MGASQVLCKGTRQGTGIPASCLNFLRLLNGKLQAIKGRLWAGAPKAAANPRSPLPTAQTHRIPASPAAGNLQPPGGAPARRPGREQMGLDFSAKESEWARREGLPSGVRLLPSRASEASQLQGLRVAGQLTAGSTQACSRSCRMDEREVALAAQKGEQGSSPGTL